MAPFKKSRASLVLLLVMCWTLTAGAQTVTQSYYVHTSIRYRFASTTFISTVRNTASSIRDVGFSVALPKDAYVVDFSMITAGKTYKGDIKERTVLNQGEAGGGDSRQMKATRDSNKFGVSLQVAAGANATFTLAYMERLKRKHGVYEHRVYLNPGHAVRDLLVEVFISENQKLTVLRVPALRTPAQTLGGEGPVGANPLARTDRPTSYTAYVAFAPTVQEQGSTGLAHTFLVQYDVAHSPSGDIVITDGYFIHFFAPDSKPLPKNIIFVLDISGSMSGEKMTQMKAAINEILGDLQPADHFNIVVFNSGAHVWRYGLMSANSASIRQAREYVDSLFAHGGTNIYAGITTARDILRKHSTGSVLDMIFFLTDGQDRSNIPLDTAIPIYGLAFGDDADLEFIKELSSKNAGFSKKIYLDINANTQVAMFYDEISNVTMTDVKFEYTPGSVDRSTLTQTKFPVIFQGSEVMVMGKLKDNVTEFGSHVDMVGNAGKANVDVPKTQVENLAPHNLVSVTNTTKLPGPAGVAAPSIADTLAKAWAFATIQEKLEEEEKRATSGGQTDNLEVILNLSLKYKFVTPVTSVVVSDPDTGGQLVQSIIQNEEEQRRDSRTIKFIKSRPPTTTTTTTTTTTPKPTPKPWCPPKKLSIDDVIKGDFLLQPNASRVVEKCLGTKKNSFRFLLKAMSMVSRLHGVTTISDRKQYDVKDNLPRLTLLTSITVSDGQKSVCLNSERSLEKDSTYVLIRSSNGTDLYLQTSGSYTGGTVMPDRLIFNSSTAQLTTIFMATKEGWRITGDAPATTDIQSPYRMSMAVENVNVTLQRFMGLAMVYKLRLQLDPGRYGGMLGDRLEQPDDLTGSRSSGRSNVESWRCKPLAESPLSLKAYMAPAKTFLDFYLNMLLDLAKNHPVHLYDQE